MDASQRDFTARVSRVKRRHTALGAGYTAALREDGLIVVQPHQFKFKFPARGFVLLMAAFMIFKGYLLAYLGPEAYGSKLTALEATTYGDVGAFIMGVDPVTDVIARLFGYVLG